ncbi:hypothetical protein GCM10027347_57050 [Larkinella harenae]
MASIAQRVTDLQKRIQKMDLTIRQLECTTVFAADLCILDTLQAKRYQLEQVKSHRAIYFHQLHTLGCSEG